MTAEFLSANIWPTITKNIRATRTPCFAAVAYFGAGSSRRLPLPPGSKLVVNASLRAVTSGQTCPADLQLLLESGVSIYSLDNLHAKVFVISKTVFVGSNNASQMSATHWIEAAIRNDNPSIVRNARTFVLSLCSRELGPELLANLATQYRPPINVEKGVKKLLAGTSRMPAGDRVILTQLVDIDWSQQDEALEYRGMEKAGRLRKHPTWILERYKLYGRCRCKPHDVVIQITEEAKGKFLVSSPANVIQIEQERRDGNRLVSIVILERENLRRRDIKSIARKVECTEGELMRDGVVQNRSLAGKLQRAWQ